MTAFPLLAMIRQSYSLLDNSRLHFQTTIVFIFRQQASSFFDNSSLHFLTTVVFIIGQQLSSFLDDRCLHFRQHCLHFKPNVFILRQQSSSFLDSRLHFQTTIVFIFRQSINDMTFLIGDIFRQGSSSFLDIFYYSFFISRQRSFSFLENSRLHYQTSVVFILRQQSSSLINNSCLHFQTTVFFIFRQQSSSFF